MSKQAVIIYQHVDHPEWGRGVVVEADAGRQDRLDISFEKGGRRTILKTFSSKLMPVVMPTDEAVSLGAKLSNRRAPSARAGVKKSKSAGAASVFPTFEAQLAYFLKQFPDGFRGETFEKEERGAAGAKRRKTDKGPAIEEAAVCLSKESFATQSEEWIFDQVANLLRTTSFVHPLEGANSLDSMKPEYRSEYVDALKNLLYGTEDEGDRFDRWVAAIRLDDTKGEPKRPSWPLTTMLPAVVHPETNVCVKPTFFQRQAALMKVPLDYQPKPDALVYSRFQNVVRKTEEALREAGQDPRDFVDVSSFICLTQSVKLDPKD